MQRKKRQFTVYYGAHIEVDEILEQIWPSTVLEHINALDLLDEMPIETVIKHLKDKGYTVTPIPKDGDEDEEEASASPTSPAHAAP